MWDINSDISIILGYLSEYVGNVFSVFDLS